MWRASEGGGRRERLTRKNWRNLDPWETCGQDNYCKRGCHEQGGCTKGCIVPRIYARLAAYEDTGLEPEEIKVHEAAKYNAGYYHGDEDRCRWIEKELGPIDHLRDLLQAEQDGRLVLLPCKVGDTVWLLKKKCKYAGEDNDPWCSCDQYWDNVYHKHMWGCAGKDDEGKQFDCEKRDMEWYAQQIEYSLVLYSPNIVLGKNLFLTREEAEAALKGGEG